MREVAVTPGQRIAGYRVESLIARGGTAVVYRATEVQLERTVALKLLSPELADHDDFQRRFLNESRLAASIDHPNIIPIYAAGEADGVLYIAMRFVVGSDLSVVLKREGRLEVARAVATLRQVASALDAAHDVGLVHRDVKPGNILISSRSPSGAAVQDHEHVYLTDFGITKRTAATSGLTATGTFVGTLDYIAPEQIRGTGVQPATDVYSLGCLAYSVLTGHVPFEREDDAALIWAHVSDHPPAPSSWYPRLGKHVDSVLARAMAKKPTHRYPTCRAFIDELCIALDPPRTSHAATAHSRAHIGDAAMTIAGPGYAARHALEPAVASTDTTTAPSRHRPSRRRLLLGGAVLAVAALTVAGVLLPRLGAPGKPTLRTGSTASTSVPLSSSPETSAVRSTLPRTSTTPVSSAAPISAGVPTPSVLTTIRLRGIPTFVVASPNGHQVYVADRESDLVHVVDTRTNKVTRDISIPAGPPRYLAFAPDGRKLYVSVYNDTATISAVCVVSMITDSVVATIRVASTPYEPVLNANGTLLYVPNHDSGLITVINTRTDKVRTKFSVPQNPHWLAFSHDGSRLYVADHESNVVAVVDTSNNKVIHEIPVPMSPHSVALQPEGPLLANADYDANKVAMIDTRTNKVIKRVPVGKHPQDVAWSADGRFVYAVSTDANSVSVIMAKTFKRTATIDTKSQPTAIAVLPDNSRAYISNSASADLTVLDLTG